jgi:steroid 5-alpha reductase family enzyme
MISLMGLVVIGIRMPGWLLPWIVPVEMGWSLLKVTGIPWMKRQALANRGENYRAYQRMTNAIFPWFSRGSQ